MPDGYHPNLIYRLGYTGFLHTRVREVPAYSNADVVFIGSSHAYRGFDTRIFNKHGITSFNLGSSAQTPIQSEHLFKHHIKQLKPKLIVYEVYPARFEIDGVESALDVLANDQLYGSAFLMTLIINHIKVYNSLVYSAFLQLFALNSGFKEPVKRGIDTYISGGYVEQTLRTIDSLETYQPIEWKMRDDQKAAFERTLALAKVQGIPVLLIQCPVIKAKYKSITNHTEVNNYFYRVARQYGNPKYYFNCNGRVPLIDTVHFLDHAHLNQAGVEIFDSVLIHNSFTGKILSKVRQ